MKRKLITILTAFMAVALLLSLSACAEEKPDPAETLTVTATGKTEYVRNQPLAFSGVELTLTYASGKTVTYAATDGRVTASAADTSASGTHTVTFTVSEKEAVWTYTVRDPEIRLVFGDGTYDGKKELTLSAAENHTDISVYLPTPDDAAKEFAGWFTDEELTDPATFNFGESIDSSADRTLYAGYDFDYSEEFAYAIEDNNEVTLTEFVNADPWASGRLTIPKTIKLRPVTKIAAGFINESFASYYFYDELYFEEGSSVREIGENAFYGMYAITSVTLPESLQKIGAYAFSGLQIERQVFPASLETIEEGAFEADAALQELVFAENSKLKYLGDNVFANCTALSDVDLPESVASIGSYAFSGCSMITNVKIGGNVRNIGVHAFRGCSNLTSIDVDERNAAYASVEGNLYTKDKKTFVRYSFGKDDESFVVPAGVTSIFESAFDAKNINTALRTIELPDTLTYIGDYAFRACSADIVLPKNLKTIADYAFTEYPTKEFVLAEDNKNFTVKDGVLYSADGKDLLAVPMEYDSELFIFDTVTERVLTGAFGGNDTIKYVVIPENSALQSIAKNSLSLFTMRELCGLYVEKSEPFEVADGALHGGTVYNNNFAVYINAALAPKYLEAWKEYSKESGGEAMGLGDYILSDEQIAAEFLQRMANLVGDFTTVEEFTTLLDKYFDMLSFHGSGCYYYFMPDFRLLEGAYFSGTDFSSIEAYLKLYETRAIRFLTKYYAAMDLEIFSQAVSFYKIFKHYQALPASFREELQDVDAEILALLDRTDEVIEKQESIIRRANELVASTTDEFLDKEAIASLLADYSMYGLTALSDYRWSDYLHVCKLQCSMLIAEFMDTEMTADNLKTLRNLSRRHFSDSYDYFLGIEDYLSGYFKSYSSREHLYRWRDYVEKYEEFSAKEGELVKEIVNRVINYDLSAPFDIALAQKTIDLYDSLGVEERSDEDIVARNRIAYRFLVNMFIKLDLSVDNEYEQAKDLYNNAQYFSDDAKENCGLTEEEKTAFDAQVEALEEKLAAETPDLPDLPDFPEFPDELACNVQIVGQFLA